MLTYEDLQLIRGVVREEVHYETKSIRSEIQTAVAPIIRELKKQRREISRIKKIIDIMAKLFDSEDMKLRKRVDRIEKYLNL